MRHKDPDDLRVKPHNGKIFIWWNFNPSGPSGTLTLTNETAQAFAIEIEHSVLSNKAMENTNETGTDSSQ